MEGKCIVLVIVELGSRNLRAHLQDVQNPHIEPVNVLNGGLVGVRHQPTRPTDLVELGFLGNVIPVDLPDLPVLLLLVNLDDLSVCRLPPCLHITAVVGLEDVVQCLGGLR